LRERKSRQIRIEKNMSSLSKGTLRKEFWVYWYSAYFACYCGAISFFSVDTDPTERLIYGVDYSNFYTSWLYNGGFCEEKDSGKKRAEEECL